MGLFSWCTILAVPITGALASVHSVSTPTLARMRRDDGSRYGESVQVVMRTLGIAAAVAAGCLIGLAHPTIRYVFGARWLPATTAVQFCLAGTIPTAILAVLYSDANARLMRRTSLVSALTGAAVTVAALWPLGVIFGVGGASAAAYFLGPTAAAAVFVWGIPASVTGPVIHSLRLFVPLVAASFVLGDLVRTPAEFAAACAAVAVLGLIATFVAEGKLVRRLVRVMRTRSSAPQPIQPGDPAAASISA
jgi:O-antigen/teichoic acid export membrane protein